MVSSTSSSEFENTYQTMDGSGRGRIALKTILLALASFGTVSLLFYFFSGGINFNDRVIEQRLALSQITANAPGTSTVLVLGSSLVEAWFEPVLFDALLRDKGINSVSYNYGASSLHPEFQRIVTGQIRQHFESSNRTLKLTLLEFNPFQTTHTRQKLMLPIRDQNLAQLLSAEEIGEITRSDPVHGIQLLTIRYLRNGVSAQLLTSLLSFQLSQEQASEELLQAQRTRREYATKFATTISDPRDLFAKGAWDPVLRGGRANKSILSEEAHTAMGEFYATYRDPAFMNADLARRVAQTDILQLDFDEDLVQDFIGMVNDLKAISETMEIVLWPRNTLWVKYSPETQRKLDALLDRISIETGVPVQNFQTIAEITPEHFVDTTHLSVFDGLDIFTGFLADRYAPVLAETTD